jgi:hypothetical protein
MAALLDATQQRRYVEDGALEAPELQSNRCFQSPNVRKQCGAYYALE